LLLDHNVQTRNIRKSIKGSTDSEIQPNFQQKLQ